MFKKTYFTLFIGLLLSLKAWGTSIISPEQIDAIAADQTMVASELELRFIGFLVSSNHIQKNVALVKDLTTNKTLTVRYKSQFKIKKKKYRVIGVELNRVIIQDGTKIIDVYKDGFGKKAKKTSPKVAVKKAVIGLTDDYKEDGFERNKDKIHMSEDYRKKILSDLPKILMQSSAEPVMDKEGHIIGFLIDQIEEDSIYGKAGLKNGDIVKSINGEELDNVADAIKVLQGLKGANHVDFTFIRGGQDVPVSVKVQ